MLISYKFTYSHQCTLYVMCHEPKTLHSYLNGRELSMNFVIPVRKLSILIGF